MNSLVIILICIIPTLNSYAIDENEGTTWKLYEVTPTEREQVTLLRTMISGYPMKMFVNGELREDETVFFLMKGADESDILKDFRDAKILHEKLAKRVPSKNKENVFGVYGGDVSVASTEE